MIRFIIKRLMYGILVLIGVVMLVFFLFDLTRIDPARLTLGQRADVESIEKVRKRLGLDLDIGSRFLLYLNDVSPISIHNHKNPESPSYLDDQEYDYSKVFSAGNKTLVFKVPYLRRSYQSGKSVTELLLERVPSTMILAVTAMLIATIIGILIGVIAAVKPNSAIDRACIAGSVLGISSPSFFSGIVFQLVFAVMLGGLTGFNISGGLFVVDPYTGKEYLELKNLVLPAVVLGIRPIAVISQLTRSSMLDILSMDYVRTAKAKGLNKRKVIFKHALRNALNPVVTSVSGWLAGLFAGSFFVESIYNFNGLGSTTVDALKTFDFPVVMGAVLFIAFMFVMINILVDIVYGILDPRIRSKATH